VTRLGQGLLGAASALTIGACALLMPASGNAAAPDRRPNFLVIVADDLGFSDLGAFGGEIRTPNLDELAHRGLRLTNFHATPLCAVTRSELLSGTDNHIAGEGWMGGGPPKTRGAPGYEDYLNNRVVAVSELLHDAGYYTLMAGKWHLGVPIELSPAGRGFDKSYALLGGAWLHFKPDARTPPIPLVTLTKFEENSSYTTVPDDFYSSNFYASKVIQYLEERKADEKRRPFFAYLTFTAPHWPLQALKEDQDKYKGVYDDGPEALRQRRLQRQAALGLLTPAQAKDAHPLEYGTPFSQLSPDERAVATRKMEIYAAMVDRMDVNVGRVIKALRDEGELDNTVIVFLADNGAEGSRFVQPTGFDNSPGNIGNVSSFAQYGIEWAQAATAPSRMEKEYTAEGGIRVPAFVTYRGQAHGHGISHAFATVEDVTPTILDLAGVAHPDTYAGHRVAPMLGHSMVPFLEGRSRQVHAPGEVFGWEQWGQRAVRVGTLKGLYEAEPGGVAPRWQVYDLATDPGENHDLAPANPALITRLTRLWYEYARSVGVVVTSPTIPGYDGELNLEPY
jgi:arylsulfatase A-like enzyme